MIQIIGTFPTDFHWVSECMRVMRYTFMDWQNNSWNINEFEKHFSVIYSLVVFCKSYFFILFYGCHFVIFLLLSSLCTTSRHSITLSRLSKNLFQAPFMTRRVLLRKGLFLSLGTRQIYRCILGPHGCHWGCDINLDNVKHILCILHII